MKLSNYQEINKGCLKAKFNVNIEEWGLTIRDCCVFEKGGRKWIGLPSRQYQAKDGTTKSFDYVIFDREKRDRFEKACFKELKFFDSYETVSDSNESMPF